MARTRIVIDLSTGQQSEVPYTPEEEAAADAAYAAEHEARTAADAEANGAALEVRRRDEAKDEISKLAEKGDLASVAAALKKAIELI
jgi:hypothetical protein